MQTARDAEIVHFIGQVGAGSADHIMARFGMGRSWAYARLSSLVRDGLLEQRTLLHRQPGLYIATREGLRWTHQSRVGVFRVSPGGFRHAWELTTVVVGLQARLPGWQVIAEREMRARERNTEIPIGSVRLAELPGGGVALHRPDIALVSALPDRERYADVVEVELSLKSAQRLSLILRAYTRARHLNHVYYLAAPEVIGPLGRAVSAMRASDVVTVLALDALDELAQSVAGEDGDA